MTDNDSSVTHPPTASEIVGRSKDPVLSEDNPFEHPQAARQRRQLVLDAMEQQGYVTAKEADAAAAAPLPAGPHSVRRGNAAGRPGGMPCAPWC